LKELFIKYPILSFKKNSELFFAVHLVEHCNLNCAYCEHFSPIAEKYFLSIESFSSDIERLGKIFGNHCKKIVFNGGEPLLHPNINDFLVVARKNFISGRILVNTNGILLDKMPTEFFITCKENNIRIIVSKYNINLNHKEIFDKVQKYGVKINFFENFDKTTDKNSFCYKPLDLEGKQDYKLNFLMCQNANKCISLREGKLFPCNFSAYKYHLNRKFGLNLEESEKDYINIYSNYNKEEILELLTHPIPCCRYCLPEKIIRKPWKISTRKIGEWI